MVLQQICFPALIYFLFSITQVFIDTFQGSYNMALVKIWVAFIFTVLLNYLCVNGLGIVSWLIVFIPFILMTVIVSMLLVMFGLDPQTGKVSTTYNKNASQKPDERATSKRRRERNRRHGLDRFTSEEYAKWRKYNESKQINNGYDESNISDAQKNTLDNIVASRANLQCDPLHYNCKGPLKVKKVA